MELPGSNIKRFLIFSYILGNGNPQKNPYVSGNRTFKSRARKKKKKIHPEKNYLYLRK